MSNYQLGSVCVLSVGQRLSTYLLALLLALVAFACLLACSLLLF